MSHEFDTNADDIETKLAELRPRALDESTLYRLKTRGKERSRQMTLETRARQFFRNPWAWSGALIVILFALSHANTPTEAPTAASRRPVISTLRDVESNRVLARKTQLAILPGPSDTQIQLIRYQWIDFNHGRSEDGADYYWPEFSSEVRPVLLNAY